MPPRKKIGQVTLPGLSSTRELHATLWKAADKLRGSMDAAQYKDFVLGLVFLKYVSDSFAERREQIQADVLADGVPETRLDAFLDDKDEYNHEVQPVTHWRAAKDLQQGQRGPAPPGRAGRPDR
jgi:type I restriction enzyme M protein